MISPPLRVMAFAEAIAGFAPEISKAKSTPPCVRSFTVSTSFGSSGRERARAAQLRRQRELGLVDVDADDLGRPGDLGRHHRVEADAAQSEHGDVLARAQLARR